MCGHRIELVCELIDDFPYLGRDGRDAAVAAARAAAAGHAAAHPGTQQRLQLINADCGGFSCRIDPWTGEQHNLTAACTFTFKDTDFA